MKREMPQVLPLGKETSTSEGRDHKENCKSLMYVTVIIDFMAERKMLGLKRNIRNARNTCLDVSVSQAYLMDTKALRNKAGAGGLVECFLLGTAY